MPSGPTGPTGPIGPPPPPPPPPPADITSCFKQCYLQNGISLDGIIFPYCDHL
jgi:hypothetical protein